MSLEGISCREGAASGTTRFSKADSSGAKHAEEQPTSQLPPISGSCGAP